MTLRRITIIAAFLVTVGCATTKLRTPAPEVEEPRQPGQDGEAPATPSANAAPAAVRVTIMGTVVKRGGAIEICPGRITGACPGVHVTGKVDDAWLSTPDHVAMWRLTGMYDGASLALDAPAERTTLADEPDYRNECPQFQAPKRGVNPDAKLSSQIEAVAAEYRERVAGQWWDRERQTMVIWVTGDAAELQRSIATRAPGARICVQGGARFSEAELEAGRAKADEILRARGVVPSSSAGYPTLNQISYEVDAIDQAALAQVASETGGAVKVIAFIELLANELAQLPAPPPRGDVVLLTKRHRSGGGMSALGRFTVRYDAEQRCVYFETPEERVLPVWFFGYWATSSPLRIYDYDDNLVAKEGDTIELGGGQADVEHAGAANTCGAKAAWYVSSKPEIVK